MTKHNLTMKIFGKKILGRFHHLKGHGVHSPFVYNFITKVIDEKSHYYAYSEIETKVKVEAKNYNRFLFRLTNYMGCDSVTIFYPEEESSILYPAMVSPSTSCHVVMDKPFSQIQGFIKDHHLINITPTAHSPEKNISSDDTIENYRLIIIENWKEDETKNKIDLLEDKTIVVIKNIRKNKKLKKYWKTLQKHSEAHITLDMHSIGVVFVNKSFKKQHYKIYFNHG